MSADKERVASRNRELMPNVAALVDEWRQYFPGLKVIYAKDEQTGHSVGNPTPFGHGWQVPDDLRAPKKFDKKGVRK